MDSRYQTIITRNSKIVSKACQEAYDYNIFICLIGNPGWGKSLELSQFKETHPNVYMKEIDHSMKPIDVYNEIIRVFGRKQDESANPRKSITKATNLIKSIKTKSLFIIDEAGKFKPSMQQSIREFHDKIKDHSSIILSGPKSFKDMIDKYRKDNKYGMLEMWSRIEDWVYLKKPNTEEYTRICLKNGFEDTDQIEKLIFKCEDFRQLHNRIQNYWRRHGGTRAA